MTSLLDWWKSFTRPEPRQTTWVYCPGCKRDLCTEPNTTFTDTDLVRYVCGNCGTKSSWLFDAPVPISIEETQ